MLNSRIYHSDEVNATIGHHSFIVKANIEGLKCQCRFVYFLCRALKPALKLLLSVSVCFFLCRALKPALKTLVSVLDFQCKLNNGHLSFSCV